MLLFYMFSVKVSLIYSGSYIYFNTNINDYYNHLTRDYLKRILMFSNREIKMVGSHWGRATRKILKNVLIVI